MLETAAEEEKEFMILLTHTLTHTNNSFQLTHIQTQNIHSETQVKGESLHTLILNPLSTHSIVHCGTIPPSYIHKHIEDSRAVAFGLMWRKTRVSVFLS